MELIEKLIEYVGIEVETPGAFSPIHIKSIISVITLTLILCIGFHSVCDLGYRCLMGLMSAVMISGELVKIVIPGLALVDGAYQFTFDWTSIPFQLCSTPLYVLPFLCLLPDGKARDVFAAYTMTFCLIGGLAVYATPDTVLTAGKFANTHTMVHHGLQIVAGIYTAVYYRSRITKRFYTGGVTLFAIFIGIATVLNTVGYDHMVKYGKITEGTGFNMFYISPRADQTVPMYNDFLKSLHPVVFILGYFAALSFIALVIMLVTHMVNKLICRSNGVKKKR